MPRKAVGPRPEGIMTRPQCDLRSEYTCTDCGTILRSIHDINLHYQKWYPTENNDTGDDEEPLRRKMKTDDDNVFNILLDKALE